MSDTATCNDRRVAALEAYERKLAANDHLTDSDRAWLRVGFDDGWRAAQR